MRRVLLALCMVVLPGCGSGVSGQQIPLPGGGHAYDLRCPGGLRSCQAKADQLCTRGHDVLRSDASGQLLVRCRGENQPLAAAPSATLPAPAATAERTVDQIVRAVRQSVYLVTTPIGRGTGFAIRGGRIVTNLHLVSGQYVIAVTDAQGQRRQVVGVRGFDSERDLAILDAGIAPSPGLDLAQPELPAAGVPVIVVGHPQSSQRPVSSGVISGIRSVGPELSLLQIDAPIALASSAGPVLNHEGKVIALLVGTPTSGGNLNAALPVRYVKDSLTASTGLITMSTFAAITAQPAAPSTASRRKKPAFPGAVAGLAFGMSITEAQQVCKSRLSGGASFATCSMEPVPIPFVNNNVSMRFESGRLRRIYLRISSWDDVTTAMLAKYGPPNLVEVRNGGSFAPGSIWKKATASRVTWWLEGGTLVVFSLDGRDLALIYISSADER